MAVSFYMDHNVPRAITVGLRTKKIDVLTAFEDMSHELSDSDLLDRAGELERILFTRDYHFLKEAAQRQNIGKDFTGIIYAHQLKVTIGVCISNLELVAKIAFYDELCNRVIFLPI